MKCLPNLTHKGDFSYLKYFEVAMKGHNYFSMLLKKIDFLKKIIKLLISN